MYQHKKLTLGMLCVLALIACVHMEGWAFWSLSAAAQGVAPANNVFDGIINATVIVATAMETLAFMVFHFLQFFLDPLFILDVNGTEALRDIWKYSRDIVNVIFAFMLIIAGIYTVVTGQKELVEQKYKRFILAVILVNFSWFFPRVILDAANVLTATIYQIPAGLSDNNQIDCKLPPKDGEEEGEDCRVIIDIKYFKGCKPPPAPPPGGSDYVKKGILCYSTGAWNAQTNTAYGMLNGLVINYAQLPELTRVLNPAAGPGGAGAPEERLQETLTFIIHIIFILVLMTMLFLPLAAMFVVFLIRIPIMWFTIAFMPFMFIGFVIGDKMGQFDTMKIFQHYVKAAFLPTVVAIPFAVGFMILAEFSQINCKDIAVAKDLCDGTGPILTNVDTLWGLLILLMTFFVIWQGFWMAISIDDIYVKTTESIKGFGQSIGKTALKLPFSVPIIPAGTLGKDSPAMSILGIDDKISKLGSALSAGTPITEIGKGRDDGSKKVTDAINDTNMNTNQELERILKALEGKQKAGTLDRTKIDTELRTAFDRPDVQKELGPDTSFDDFKRGIGLSTFSKRLEALRKDQPKQNPNS